jgi:pilus assembly protein FimV
MSTAKRDLIIQEAEKLAAKGKLDAAIKEYKRALDQAPRDTNALNRLGDLLVRASRIAEAIEVYQRIATHFAEDGFFLKAVAIYKKVNRLDPSRTETYELLADLYFKQGLVVEGRQQMVTLADWFLRSKQPKEAVRVYRRLIELEPSNFQARAKLIDLSVQMGDVGSVGTEIDALGRALLGRGMLDEAVKLYHRALDLKTEHGDFIAPCVDALLAAGRATQAVALARKALGATKGGLELKCAAARALLESGDIQAARKLVEEVLPQAGGRVDIVQLYSEVVARGGGALEASEAVLSTVDRLLEAGDLGRAATLVERLLRSNTGNAQILERALKVFSTQNDADMVVNIETALADVYFREGRKSEAVELYKGLAQQDPANVLFSKRLKELGVVPPLPSPAPAAAPPSPPVPTAAHPGPELEYVEVDFDSNAAAPAQAAPPPPPPVSIPAELFDAGPSPGETSLEELYTEAVVFAKYGLTDKAVAHLERLLGIDPSHARGRELFDSLGGVDTMGVELGRAVAKARGGPPVPPSEPAPVETPRAPVARTQMPRVEMPRVEIPQTEIPHVDVPRVEMPSPLSARDAAGARDALSAFAEVPHAPAPQAPEPPIELSLPVPEISLDELAGQMATPEFGAEIPALGGFSAVPAAPAAPRSVEARRAPTGAVRLDNLEAMLGLREPGAPAAHAPAPDVPAGAPPPSPPVPAARRPEPEPVEALDEAVELVEMSGVLTGPGEDQLRELDFLIQQGLLDDAGKLLDKIRAAFPEHPDIVTRQALLKARGWDEERREVAPEASAAELFSEEEQFFDLAAELEKELAEEEMVAQATGAGMSGEVSIEELFKEFQRGVAEQVHEEDYDTHFNLGLAYREMDLLEEAIGEFQLSVKSPDYLVESASMIGACYMDKGLAEQAAEWYARALTAEGLPFEVKQGLQYELGRAQEAAGNTASALATFTMLVSANPAYRDVADRISKLRSN